MKHVTIAGAGTLGAQISWQTAFKGFEVTVYDIDKDGLETGKRFHREFAELFLEKRGASQEEIDNTFGRITYTTNLAEAVTNADIVSESIPEKLEIKKSFYKELAKLAPPETIFTTNTSSLLPSEFAAETGRPDKFLAMHFANRIWDARVAEVMQHEGTDRIVFDKTVAFVREIGLIPIPIYKEHRGYVLNSLLIPFLSAATNLLVEGVTDHETIDKTWMVCTGVKVGPLGILDLVGLETMYNVCISQGAISGDKSMLKRAEFVKENFINKGKLGIKTGEGFYSYPNPRYTSDNFLN